MQEDQQNLKENSMKNSNSKENDTFRDEYDFSDSKPNPYAAILRSQQNLVQLEPDVAKYYKTSEQVNIALRAIISAFPKSEKSMAETT